MQSGLKHVIAMVFHQVSSLERVRGDAVSRQR